MAMMCILLKFVALKLWVQISVRKRNGCKKQSRSRNPFGQSEFRRPVAGQDSARLGRGVDPYVHVDQ